MILYNNRTVIAMLDYNITLELMQKYGLSSNEPPYIFFDEPDVGICYEIDDEDEAHIVGEGNISFYTT